MARASRSRRPGARDRRHTRVAFSTPKPPAGWQPARAGTPATSLVGVVGRTRLRRAVLVAASLAVLCGVLLWIVLNLAPLRTARLGPFARGLVTPAAALAATRREHPTASWPMFGGSPSRVRFSAGSGVSGTSSPSALASATAVRCSTSSRGAAEAACAELELAARGKLAEQPNAGWIA